MKKFPLDLSDALALTGVICMTVGLWMIYKPASVVALGAYLFLCSRAAGSK